MSNSNEQLTENLKKLDKLYRNDLKLIGSHTVSESTEQVRIRGNQTYSKYFIKIVNNIEGSFNYSMYDAARFHVYLITESEQLFKNISFYETPLAWAKTEGFIGFVSGEKGNTATLAGARKLSASSIPVYAPPTTEILNENIVGCVVSIWSTKENNYIQIPLGTKIEFWAR